MNKSVYDYYNKLGWAKDEQGQFLDTQINENLQKNSMVYNKVTRERVLLELMNQPKCEYRKILDCASGPVQYPEYAEYSSKYKARYCVDFSVDALKHAEENLIKAGQNSCKFICNDLFEVSFDNNYFDSTISLHTLYHVDKARQEDFVSKLIDCTKPGMKVIIVYSNPFSLRSCLALPLNTLLLVRAWIKKHIFGKQTLASKLYFARHSIGWWARFETRGSVKIKSYRFLAPAVERRLIPDNWIGRLMYKVLFSLESTTISKYFSEYYMVVIKKHVVGIPTTDK